MKILVEEYSYQSVSAQQILNCFEPKQTANGVSSDYVGYCYSRELQDCVFFLPKVILNKNDKIFNDFSPEQVVNLEKSPLNDEQRDFLSGLSIWTYRALKEYSAGKYDTKVLREQTFSDVNTGEHVEGTYLDVILSLVKFYNENKDFFIYTLRNIHSQQHKINWQKTISRTQAVIQDDVPVYLDPISKKKQINWDEELLIIFFSILDYINKYGFGTTTEYHYELITGELFQSYLDGLGTRKLRQIKYKYFSDKTRQLWQLCYTFFAKAEEMSSSKQSSDFLMATSFHVVFEAMIDELLGDKQYDDWKKLGDGKVLDHIYRFKSVCSPDETFYIGDSKYYRTKTGVKEKSESTFKQFTYARAIVNDSIRRSLGDTWPYRDPLTESYAVIPNFFIGAETDPQLRYDLDGLDDERSGGVPFLSRQFVNRLFDRDTLWVRQYNINFLYVLSSYASADDTTKKAFREKAHSLFRKKTIELLNSKYDFFVLNPKDGKSLEEVMTNDMKWTLRGVACRMGKNDNRLLLAIERKAEGELTEYEYQNNYYIDLDIEAIEKRISEVFIKTPCALNNKAEMVTLKE